MSRRPDAFKQGVPSIGLSLERGTPGVPDDGRYHVVLNGEIVHTERTEAAARQLYVELRDKLLPAQESMQPNRGEILRKIRTQHDLDAVSREAAQQKRAKAIRKGGKGGTGGVGG